MEWEVSLIKNAIGDKYIRVLSKEEGDTKEGIIIPKDKFKEFVKFQKEWVVGRV